MSEPRTTEEKLALYAAGRLSPQEERELFLSALDDQETFNALAHEYEIRQALEDPASRQVIFEAIEARMARQSRFTLPRVALAAAVAVALVVAGIVFIPRARQPIDFQPTNQEISNPPNASILTSEARARIDELAAAAPSSGPDLTIGLPAGATVPLGGSLSIELRTARAAALLLLEFTPGEPDRILLSSNLVRANQSVPLPPAPARIQGLPGIRTRELLAFPPGTDLAACLNGTRPWPAASGVRTASITVNPQ